MCIDLKDCDCIDTQRQYEKFMCNKNCGSGGNTPCTCRNPLKIEVGKTYLTAKGGKVKIHAKGETLVDTYFNFIGEHLYSGRIYKFRVDGQSQYVGEPTLISEYKEPDYRWYNYYRSGWDGFHKIKEDAIKYRTHGFIGGFIGTYRIDLNTGDILREEV